MSNLVGREDGKGGMQERNEKHEHSRTHSGSDGGGFFKRLISHSRNASATSHPMHDRSASGDLMNHADGSALQGRDKRLGCQNQRASDGWCPVSLMHSTMDLPHSLNPQSAADLSTNDPGVSVGNCEIDENWNREKKDKKDPQTHFDPNSSNLTADGAVAGGMTPPTEAAGVGTEVVCPNSPERLDVKHSTCMKKPSALNFLSRLKLRKSNRTTGKSEQPEKGDTAVAVEPEGAATITAVESKADDVNDPRSNRAEEEVEGAAGEAEGTAAEAAGNFTDFECTIYFDPSSGLYYQVSNEEAVEQDAEGGHTQEELQDAQPSSEQYCCVDDEGVTYYFDQEHQMWYTVGVDEHGTEQYYYFQSEDVAGGAPPACGASASATTDAEVGATQEGGEDAAPGVGLIASGGEDAFTATEDENESSSPYATGFCNIPVRGKHVEKLKSEEEKERKKVAEQAQAEWHAMEKEHRPIIKAMKADGKEKHKARQLLEGEHEHGCESIAKEWKKGLEEIGRTMRSSAHANGWDIVKPWKKVRTCNSPLTM